MSKETKDKPILVKCKDCGRSFYIKEADFGKRKCFYCPYYRPKGELIMAGNKN